MCTTWAPDSNINERAGSAAPHPVDSWATLADYPTVRHFTGMTYFRQEVVPWRLHFKFPWQGAMPHPPPRSKVWKSQLYSIPADSSPFCFPDLQHFFSDIRRLDVLLLLVSEGGARCPDMVALWVASRRRQRGRSVRREGRSSLNQCRASLGMSRVSSQAQLFVTVKRLQSRDKPASCHLTY